MVQSTTQMPGLCEIDIEELASMGDRLAGSGGTIDTHGIDDLSGLLDDSTLLDDLTVFGDAHSAGCRQDGKTTSAFPAPLSPATIKRATDRALGHLDVSTQLIIDKVLGLTEGAPTSFSQVAEDLEQNEKALQEFYDWGLRKLYRGA